MSSPLEDFQLLGDKLESWATLIPDKAEAFHKRRLELIQEKRGATGAFGSDAAPRAAVQTRFQELAQLLPNLQELIALSEQARANITELRAITPASGPLHAAVQDATDEWLALMDFLVHKTSDARAASLAIFQVKRITTWVAERKQALAILSGAGALQEAVHSSQYKNEIKKAIGDWSRVFCEGKVHGRWKAEAEQALKRFEAFRQEEARTEALEKQLAAKRAEEAAAVSVQDTAGADAPAGEQVAERARMHFFRIDQALAECRDLADALEYGGQEISEFTSRQWQLRDRPDASIDEIQKIEDDIEFCRKSLLQRAEAEADRRLQQVQMRWQWFRAVYDAREEIAQILQNAEAEKPYVAHRLRELFALIQQAEQRIYAVVDGNRPRLAAYVNKAADACRAEIEKLRQQSRLIKVDAALAGLERQIPENHPGSQVPARQSFERLERCYSLDREIKKMREDNNAKQAEVLATAGRLSGMVSEIAALSDAAEVAGLAARIPGELPAERRLDDIAADLATIERLLNDRRADLCVRKTAEWSRERKENLAWTRVLGDLAPEAEAFATKDAPSQDLESVCRVLEVEQRNRRSIAQIVTTAVVRLNLRREEAAGRLQARLDTPSFETHPEHESAEELLQRLRALSGLEDPPKRDEFARMYDLISEAEGFVDRIESVRRSIPEQLKKLEERFEIFRERNGIVYRPDFSSRANMLLQGIQKAIQQEQWEALPFQLSHADAYLAALERDALAQIGAETEQLVETLTAAAKRSTDPVYSRQIETALEHLEDEWQLEPPPYALRRRLSQLAGRAPSSMRGTGV